MENEPSSQLVPVHAVPVLASTDPVLPSEVLPTRQNIRVAQNVEFVQEEATSGDLTVVSKEMKAQKAAVLVEESADGGNVRIKGLEVGMLKREVAIEVDGNQVARVELQYMFIRAFEAHLSRRYHHLALGPGDELPPYEPSGFESAVYCCCQAYSCDFKGCCGRRCKVSTSDVKKSYEEPETIKKSRPIGLNVIKENFLNFLAFSLIGEAFLYFTLIFAFVELIISLVSLITDFSSDQNDQILEIISMVLSVLGTGFSFLDFSLHFRHRGCRIFKRACKGEKQEQEQDEEHKEFCNDTCANKDKKSCGNRCVSVLDIIRIFVLETIYYPDLLSTMFDFIDELISNDYNPKQIPAASWLSFTWSMLLILVTVYCAKLNSLRGLVKSVKEARPDKKFQGALFIFTFSLYMLGLMVLQMLMVATIGGRYHHDFTAGPGKISGQLWYMMVCGYLMPVLGTAMFFVVHHFWTMKLPVDLIFDLLKDLQTEGKETDNTKQDEERLVRLRRMLQYIDGEKFKSDYLKLKKIDCITKVGHPFSSPLHILLASFYSAMLLVFGLCSMIGGPSDGAWYLFYFIGGVFGTIVNMYAVAVFLVWSFFIVSVLAAVLVLIGMFLICCLICSMASSDSSNRRQY